MIGRRLSPTRTFATLCLAAVAVLAACGGAEPLRLPPEAQVAEAAPGATTAPAPRVLAAVPAQESAAEIAAANAAAWPFELPPLATLRAAPRKVFAHYFTPFPISIDNRAPERDYYAAHYLSPQGEGGKFAASGGFIKQRPLPRNVIEGTAWDRADTAQDVRRAAALGIDGFAVNLVASRGLHWERARALLDVAAAVDPGFRILLMPDMEAEFKTEPQRVIEVARALARHPAAYRLADGRLVIAPYNAQTRPVAWWADLLATLRAEGTPVALWPVLQGWAAHGAAFAPISVGLSDWGDRSPGASRGWSGAPGRARALGVMFMSTVAPQDARPKDLLYWEARNSENYRVMWEAAIAGGADAVHIVSWNDYSEATEIAPSSGTQWSFYDLTAYYTAWFKTGARPPIVRDVLYYFHRRHRTAAQPSPVRQTRPYRLAGGSDAPADDLEVLVFATTPATLRIVQGGGSSTHEVAAGLSTVRVPLAEGTPAFELRRGGRTAAAVRSGFAVDDRIDYQDLLYRSGSSGRGLVAPR